MNLLEGPPVAIAYRDDGEGPPVLLIHGFASSVAVNWEGTGWLAALGEAGRRTIAFDVRGHGDSGKLYEDEDYLPEAMASDALRLLDHLAVERVHVMGYSMGARIAASLALAIGERVAGLVFGGMADGMVKGIGGEEEIVDALLAPSLAEVTSERGRAYRSFAERNGGDLRALAACMRGQRQPLAPDEARRLAQPTMIVVGSRDTVAGSPERLADMLPAAEVVTVPGRDHLTATGDRVFKDAVVPFLERTA